MKWWLSGGALIFVALLMGPSVYAKIVTSGERHDAHSMDLKLMPKREVVIVFGAGILSNGEPTEYLRNRVGTAVDLYKAGRVNHLLLSGDNSTKHYSEPNAMQKLAIRLGVPARDITLDYAGFNTYDSCYRARKIFGVQRAILVTQGYHLPRALVTCNGLGVQSIGVAAKHTSRDWGVMYSARELISTDKALVQLTFKPSPTILGETEYITD